MLVSLLLGLRDRGVTVLYISHRIPEVLALSNRITILRDGRERATVENDGLTESSLVQMMVGRDLVSLYDPTATKQNGSGAASLAVEWLSGYGSVHDVDLTLGEGEILGVFGLEGSGSFELAETIVGLRRRRSGRLRVGTTVLRRWQPRKLLSLGVQYLHNNRKDAGLYLALDVSENAEAPRLKRLSSHGLLNRRKLSEVVRSSIQRFEIKARPRHQRVVNLSGGNQQKLMMSLCLDGVPKCFVVCEPTRGVDVGSKAQIHGFLRNVAAEGGSIMMFSSELPEIIALCTRVLIMRAGGVVGQLVGNDITEENVMARAAGASD
jgi:ABC-type sugar transport system ATPase subunit